MSKTNRIIVSIVIGVIAISLFAWMGITAFLLGTDSPIWLICRESGNPWSCLDKVGLYAICGSPIIGCILFAIMFFLLPKKKEREQPQGKESF